MGARYERRKEEIAAKALELFFENGYEATSIRMIMSSVDCSVGLFYRYFESKDEVFDAAIKMFFKNYETDMQEIVDDGKKTPRDTLTKFIEYIEVATQDFREKYLHKLHWSILGAIREYTLRIMRKFVRQIIEFYSETGIIQPQGRSLEVTANFVALSVGGSILYQDKDTYYAQKSDILKGIELLLGSEN